MRHTDVEKKSIDGVEVLFSPSAIPYFIVSVLWGRMIYDTSHNDTFATYAGIIGTGE